MRPARSNVVPICLAVSAVAFGVACPSTPPPRPQPSASASAPPPAPAVDAEAPAPDLLAPIRARGAFHGEPLKIPAAGKYPDRWLVFLGTPDVARAAWIVTPGADKDELVPVESWPLGVKVVGSVVRQSVAYVVLETVKMLDQPAGLRAVWFDGFGNTSPFAASETAFDGVRDVAELEKRIDAGPQAPKRAPDGALMTVLKAASKSEAALAATLAPRGADVTDVWQDLFAQKVDAVDAQKLSSSPRAQELLDAVKDAVTNDHCIGDECEAVTAKGHVRIAFVEDAGKWVIREFSREVAPPASTPSTTPKAVAPSATTTSTEDALRERVRTVGQVLGEAPALAGSSGATIGVAITDFEAHGPAVVLHDGDYARVFPLASMSFADANLVEPKFEARFADLDGDGRTDVIVRVAGRASDGTPVVLAQGFLAPPPSVNAAQDLIGDHGSDLALVNAPSIDAALAAALAVPPRGVAVADACKLLAGADKLPTFRKIATADVRVVTFDEPSLPAWRPRVVSESKLKPEDVKQTGKSCKELECSATRPFCVYTDGPYSELYWFVWDKSTMRLAGAAFYTGS